MKVIALSHMPFANVQRKPGDEISSEDWMGATETVRSALVSQGLVRIGGTDTIMSSRTDPHDNGEDEGELRAALGRLEARFDDFEAKLERALGAKASKPAKATKKAKAKKAKAPAAGEAAGG